MIDIVSAKNREKLRKSALSQLKKSFDVNDRVLQLYTRTSRLLHCLVGSGGFGKSLCDPEMYN